MIHHTKAANFEIQAVEKFANRAVLEKMLQIIIKRVFYYSIANIGFDTAEYEPREDPEKWTI